MKPSTTVRESEWNRAVSPVIGVILMVAITVILAAVIGAFVLEIGDQQETAPSTSFDTEESTKIVIADYSGNSGPPIDKAVRSDNLSVVDITHAGGDTIDVTQFEVKVNGNASVWGAKGDTTASAGCNLEIVPAPNFQTALGSNEQVSLSSGETLSVMLFGGSPRSPLTSTNRVPADEYVTSERYGLELFYNPGTNQWHRAIRRHDDDDLCGDGSSPIVTEAANVLLTDDTVSTVWNAESGGKTQTLVEYTVQNGNQKQP